MMNWDVGISSIDLCEGYSHDFVAKKEKSHGTSEVAVLTVQIMILKENIEDLIVVVVVVFY